MLLRVKNTIKKQMLEIKIAGRLNLETQTLSLR